MDFTVCEKMHRCIPALTCVILSIAVSDFLSCAIPVPLSIARHFQKNGRLVWLDARFMLS